MTTRIILRNSTTAGATPAALTLAVGEVAVNTADGKLYTKHVDETIRALTPDISNISQHITPNSDNALDIGSTALRMRNLYAASGVITTSDANLKTDIEAIPEEWLKAWGTVQFTRYRFTDAVATKGDSARWHVGLIAQRVHQAFESHGIDPVAIGLLCLDQWTDEEGNPQERFGVRYEEALALECAYLRWQLSQLSAPKTRTPRTKEKEKPEGTDHGKPKQHRKPRRQVGDGD
jgi:hypothetical protein